MIYRLETEAFLAATQAGPILDTRAPSEFEAGHMPGAISFPIFTDEERSKIGTLYKQVGHDRAVLQGLSFLGPRMSEVVKQAQKKFPDRKIRLHCWRGGLRSGTMAWLLDMGGFETTLLDSGYKGWRNLVLHTFQQPYKLMVLGGMTGSGKTDFLHYLKQAGEQIVDLEKLAHHKGSSFGTIGQESQPTQEQFENNLATELRLLDSGKRIWIEDENNTIGRIVIPKDLYRQKELAPVVVLDVPFENRVQKLAEEYCQVDPQLLTDAILRIKKRLGGLNTQQALEAIEQNNMPEMVRLALAYYDKAYTFQLDARTPDQLRKVPMQTPGDSAAISAVIAAADSFPSSKRNTTF